MKMEQKSKSYRKDRRQESDDKNDYCIDPKEHSLESVLLIRIEQEHNKEQRTHQQIGA
jgi:hypothetical protein